MQSNSSSRSDRRLRRFTLQGGEVERGGVFRDPEPFDADHFVCIIVVKYDARRDFFRLDDDGFVKAQGRAHRFSCPYGVLSLCLDNLVNCQFDVFRDFPQQNWRNISSFVKGNGRGSSVRMAILSMGSSPADFPEVQRLKQLGHVLRFEHGCFGYQGVTIS